MSVAQSRSGVLASHCRTPLGVFPGPGAGQVPLAPASLGSLYPYWLSLETRGMRGLPPCPRVLVSSQRARSRRRRVLPSGPLAPGSSGAAVGSAAPCRVAPSVGCAARGSAAPRSAAAGSGRVAPGSAAPGSAAAGSGRLSPGSAAPGSSDAGGGSGGAVPGSAAPGSSDACAGSGESLTPPLFGVGVLLLFFRVGPDPARSEFRETTSPRPHFRVGTRKLGGTLAFPARPWAPGALTPSQQLMFFLESTMAPRSLPAAVLLRKSSPSL